MNLGHVSGRREGSSGWLSLGQGWLGSAVFAGLALGLLYVPAHDPTAGPFSVLVTTAAMLYAVGLSIAAVRVLRGVILRLGGSREPIVLLGTGPDPLTSPDVGARWRLAAVAAGVVGPTALGIVAGSAAAAMDPATPAHAISTLVLGVNVAVAAGALVMVPGLPGWALALALADATGASPDQRQSRAARLARAVGVPILLGVVLGAVLLGDPMLLALGVALAFLTWTGGQLAARQDATARFLAGHVAGDLARPITTNAGPDEPVASLLARLRTDASVALIEGGAGIAGAVGPRQLAGVAGARLDDPCAALMVPLGSLRILGPTAGAVDVLQELARHGFALVRGTDGLGYVEAEDLGRQVRVWQAIRERRSTDDVGPREQ